MMQAGDGFGLADKTGSTFVVVKQPGVQRFKGHIALQSCVSGPVDGGKTTLPNLFEEVVSPQFFKYVYP
ncbi:MAG: hypothetical protein Kow0031_02120 [Anaerolineae bacterium]